MYFISFFIVTRISAAYCHYSTNCPFIGLQDINPADSVVYHMGTTLKDGKVVTNGGRVFCITSYGRSIYDAVAISKEEMEKITFTGMEYRSDIGYEFE